MPNQGILTIKRGSTFHFYIDFDLTRERVIHSFEGVTVKAALRKPTEPEPVAYFNCRVDAENQRIYYSLTPEQTRNLPLGLLITDTRVESHAGEVDFTSDMQIKVLRETTI